MSKETIHERFLNEVKRRGLDLSQKDFAVKMGVKEPIVSMYVNSRRMVSLPFLKRFCKLYDLDYDEFIKNEAGIPVKLSDRDLISMFLQVSGLQTEILQSIRNEMARETTLAGIKEEIFRVGANSDLVVARAEKISDRQDSGLREIQEALSQLAIGQSGLSQGEDTKPDQSDGDGQKRGRNRAKGK